MAEQWLSIVEYARQFNMSDMTVRRRIKTGRIQAVLRDGKYYIPMSEALRKLSNQQPTHTQQPNPSKQNYQRMANHEPMKSHTVGEQSFNHLHSAKANTVPQQNHYTPMQSSHDFQPSTLPPQLRQTPMFSNAGGALDSSTLIAFCEGALKKSVEAEQRLDALYKESIAKLEAEIRGKDHQIKALSQQVEDLQLLTKILERKK